MLIIGEKINGTLQKIAAAIAARDASFIQDLAKRQAEAGAGYLDINAGTAREREPEDLAWLVETVQDVTDLPLCLDSTNPAALSAGLELVARPPLINSISGEQARLDQILPLVAGRSSGVIALLLDDAGIPKDTGGRLAIARPLLEQTRATGVPDGQVYIDPLIMALATRDDGGLVALNTMRALRSEYSEVRFAVGLSNISFGLPLRSLINRAFLSLALEAGLDAAIIDPLDRDLIGALRAAELVLGRDRFCRAYTKAFRGGTI